MPQSPIRKLAKYAEAAHRNGVHIYSLNIGQPDIQTPTCATDAIANFHKDILEYTPSQGVISLRAKMVGYYAEYGIDISPDEIIVTSGGSEAIMFAYMACLNPGDEIIITEPSYANYMAFAVSCGAVMKPVKTNIEDGFKLPSVEEFEKQITDKTRAILICNPNNPTGYLYSKQEMMQIRDLVKKYDLYLFSDEVYREFIYTKRPYISAFHLEGIEDRVILIDSVSKRYSLCGVRIGALITKNKEVHQAVMKFCQARLSPPLIGQVIAESALATPHDYLEEVYDEYLSRRNFLIDQLNQIPGVFAPTPMGAFYVMVHLPVDDTESFAKWMLESFRINNETTMVTPAASFYKTPGQGKNHARIAYVLEVDEMKKALHILEEGLKAYPGRTI